MISETILRDSLHKKTLNENHCISPKLKFALRQINRMKLQGERFASIYFSNEDVVLELEQRLWGRVLLVFSENSQIDINCATMPTKWIEAQWFSCGDCDLKDEILVRIQFDSGSITLITKSLEIRKVLPSKGYLHELENRLVTDAMVNDHEFDYGLFFRVAAQNIREKARLCGSRSLRKGERELLLLDHFVLAEMNDVFKGRMSLKHHKNVSKQQRLDPIKWQKLIKLLTVCGPEQLINLVDRATYVMNHVPWSSRAWSEGFLKLNQDFENCYGEYGMQADEIYKAFSLHLLSQLNRI